MWWWVGLAFAGGSARPLPEAWPAGAWHVDLMARTDFPVDAGVALDVETPERLRLGLGLGVVPAPYVDAINAVAYAANWYDTATGDLIQDTIGASFVVHPVIGVRPVAREGFVVDAGFKLAVLGGKNTSAGLIAGLTGEEIPEGYSAAARDLRATAVVGMVTTRLGWVWEPTDHLVVRLDLGGAFTVTSTSRVSPPDGAAAERLWAPLTRAGEVYLDQTMTRYVHTPTIGVGVGWRAR